MGCVFLRVGGVFLGHLQLERGRGAQPLLSSCLAHPGLLPRAAVGGRVVSAVAPMSPSSSALSGCVGAPQTLLLPFPLPQLQPGRKWAGKGYRSGQGGLQGK